MCDQQNQQGKNPSPGWIKINNDHEATNKTVK